MVSVYQLASFCRDSYKHPQVTQLQTDIWSFRLMIQRQSTVSYIISLCTIGYGNGYILIPLAD